MSAAAPGLPSALYEWAMRHGADDDAASALASCQQATQDGHSCLDLDKQLPASTTELSPADSRQWQLKLRQSPLCAQANESIKPLILNGSRLYLQRYWDYEQRLCKALQRLLESPPKATDCDALLDAGLGFHAANPEPDRQAIAVATAMRHQFCIIAGGPGTGKTHTVLRLLLQLIKQHDELAASQPIIRLAAPTGKAAARMMESIQAGLKPLALQQRTLAALPEQAETLHRLLGIGGNEPAPRYDSQNPLSADIVVVDEASMIDLPMMTKLIEALPQHCKLILLGDRWQLASVEAGSVLSELCKLAGENCFSMDQQHALQALLPESGQLNLASNAFSDHVVTLTKSRRFDAHSPLGRLAQAVNRGEPSMACEELLAGHDALQLVDTSETRAGALLEPLLEHFQQLNHFEQPQQALTFLRRRGVLTALRRGIHGSQYINLWLQQALAQKHGADPRANWFHGRPVMIERNDYQTSLFNGDLGICLRNSDGHLRVWFATQDGLRALLPSSLPQHSSAYALTIHKSQGSEFEHVDLLLPSQDSPILSRELVYTGITRARQSLAIHAPLKVFELALKRRIERYSGLGEALFRPPHL